jgi:hypothetical protein
VILVPISNVPLEEALAAPEPIPEPGKGPESGGQEGAEGDSEANAEEGEGEAAAEGKSAKPSPGVRRSIKAIKRSFWTTNNRRKLLWSAFDIRSRARERTFYERARKYQLRQADEIREKILGYSEVGYISPAGLLDIPAEARRFREEMAPWYIDHYIRAGNAGLKATKGELLDESKIKGIIKAWTKPGSWAFDLTPEREKKLMDMIFNSGTKVNETTIDRIYKTLLAARSENATIEQFAQQIWEQVDEFSPARARLWAETESTKVDNMGMVEGYRESEFVELKGWNCQLLETSREDHIEADGQEVKLDDNFEVGGEMMDAPGDHTASAGNVCNCRCSTYPVVPEG